MPNVGTLVLPAGRQGPVGPTGPQGSIPADPASLVNGRQPGSWVPALPLRGNSVNVAEATMTGCIAFTNRTATTNTAAHINLWAGQYGIVAVATQGLGLVSGGGYFDFYTVITSSSTQALRLMGNSSYREIWFQGDGWRWQYNMSNKDFVYYSYNNSPLFGFQGAYSRCVTWGQLQTLGYYQLGGGSRGVVYANIVGTGFKFLWNGTAWVRLDNGSVDWALVNACDERIKGDIAPSTFPCLDTVRKIRLYQYRWKDHRHRPGYPQASKPDAPLIPIGFIAQRLKEDFPEGVLGPLISADGKYRPVRDRAVRNSDANVMMALLCGAVQELDNAITEQEQRRATNRT